jgi:hypothetical protein
MHTRNNGIMVTQKENISDGSKPYKQTAFKKLKGCKSIDQSNGKNKVFI